MQNNGEKIVKEYDLSNFVCPLSKIKASEALNNLGELKTIRLILGDIESLKSVAQELKKRSLKPSFERENESRFVLTVSESET